MPKPCRKTYYVENILSSVSPSPSTVCSNGVFSPLREIGNNQSSARLQSPSTPSGPPLSSKNGCDMDEEGFKRPLPRKIPLLSASQRQDIEDVKKYGLPSFTENYVLSKEGFCFEPFHLPSISFYALVFFY